MTAAYAAVVELAERNHGLVRTSDLGALGCSRRSLARLVGSGRLVPVGRGVLRLPGTPMTPVVRLAAEVMASGRAVASHRSALALFGLPGFHLASPIEMTTTGTAGPRRPSAIVHRTSFLPDQHRRDVQGIPTTSLARALLDITGVVHPRRAERAVDTALARRLVTGAALSSALIETARRGRRNTAVFRRILDARPETYVAPESVLEAAVADLCRVHGLPEARRQVDLGDADGWIGRVDFLFPGGLVVEVDGREHHSALLDRLADTERDRRLEASGRRVVRVRWAELRDRPRDLAATIRALLPTAESA